MSNVMASTRKSVRVLGLFAIMMAFAVMFSAGSASAATRTKNGFSTPAPSTGTYIVSVIDAKTKELVAGAEVEILNGQGQVVAKAVVGGNMAETDTVQFTLAEGAYKMYITADGYQKVETQISVVANQTQKSQVELQQ